MCGAVTAEVVVCEGRPADAIVQTAKRLKADTIVMHTHAATAVESNWLPSPDAAAEVVQTSPLAGILLVSPAKPGAKVDLMFVDHTTINQQSERLDAPGKPKSVPLNRSGAIFLIWTFDSRRKDKRQNTGLRIQTHQRSILRCLRWAGRKIIQP